MNAIVGTNLKLLREANDFSQDKVASFLHVGRSAYSNYENGLREPSLAILEQLSDLFGCDLSFFFEEDKKCVDNMLTYAFRIDDLSDDDLKEVASFKKIVKNYLKINQLLVK